MSSPFEVDLGKGIVVNDQLPLPDKPRPLKGEGKSALSADEPQQSAEVKARTPLQAEAEVGGEGLSERAQAAFGINTTENTSEETEEGGMIELQKKVAPKAEALLRENERVQAFADHPNMEIDTPKALWDACGHVKLYFNVTNVEDILDTVAQCNEIFARLEERYGTTPTSDGRRTTPGLTTITEKQVSFATQLLNQLGYQVPADIASLSQADAKALITRLIEERDAQGSATKLAQGRQATAAATGGKGGGTMTPPQAVLIGRLVKEDATRVLPPKYPNLSVAEASQLIKQFLGTA